MPNFHTLKISTKDQPTSHNQKISRIHYSKTWMKNQFNELKPCWLLYNRFYEKMQCNATPSLNIIKPTAKQVWLSVLNIHRTTRPAYASTATICHIDLITQKNPILNQATQKNTCQIFLPKKISDSKISNPKKSFDHPHHLKSGVPPRLLVNATSNGCDLDCKWSLKTTLDGRKWDGWGVPV